MKDLIIETYYLIRDIIDLEKYIEKIDDYKDIIIIRYKIILEHAKRIWKLSEMESFKEERIQRLVEYIEKDYKR